MNPAPDQTPVPSVSFVPSVSSTPNPVSPPVPSTPTTANPPPPITNTPLPTTNFSAPPPPSGRKFPFMMVTLFLAVILAGFAGSVLFLSNASPNSQTAPAKIIITPPVTIIPTPETNPFATSSSDLTTNPFASPTAILNPFGTYQNPFTGATVSATPQSYQNPFTQ